MKTPSSPAIFWLLVMLSSVITGLSVWLLKSEQAIKTNAVVETIEKPLYWVAPMDDNYRRDKPGKSPMGMDLVPVYAQNNNASSTQAGTVYINPHIVNNLGVRTANVKFDSLNQQITTVGYINYNQDTLVHIHPRVEGWVDQLFVKTEGVAVVKGQPLYSLYSPELVNAQEEYLLALARKDSRLLTATAERLKALHVPKQAIEHLKQSKQVQQTITFYATQHGVIENLAIREGFYVKPGTTLFSIADLSQVWLEAEIFERESNLISVGAAVLMSLDFFPAKQWQGQVDYIYPTVNQKTRTLVVRIRFNNEELLLKPNMFAKVDIQTSQREKALLIPHAALIRTSTGNRVVQALDEGRFKSVSVDVGQSDQQYFEVLSGLAEGDRVVISAQFLLDSESSKTSDFLRISDEGVAVDHSKHTDQIVDEIPSARVNGMVNGIDRENATINISREAIAKWQRPATTMDFFLSEHLNISQISIGEPIDFTFEIREGVFVITMIHSSEIVTEESMHHAHH